MDGVSGAAEREMVERETVQRDAAGRFVPGQSGNPQGKLPGTRNRKTMLMEALRDGEGEAAARVVIDKALAGDAVAARFVVALTSPKPRGREIHLEMPADDDCNVVSAFNAALRALCNGEITPDEALQVSRFLDGRRRVLQAWQLEEKLTSFGRTIPGDPEWAPDEADEDEDEDDDDSAGFDDDVDDDETPTVMTGSDQCAAPPVAGPAVADLQTACISRPPIAPEPRRATGALPAGDRLAVLAALLAAAESGQAAPR